MDFRLSNILGGSPSSSDSSSGQKSTNSRQNNNNNNHNNNNNSISSNNHYNNGGDRHENDDPMHSWWESVSKARSRIHLLSTLLPPSTVTSASLDSLADSDRPARSLLSSLEAYSAISSSLSSPLSGSGDDPLCQWLYETYQSSDSDLRLVVLSFIPLLAGLYLSRIHTVSSESHMPSLAGFEAVLLSLYAAETKSRAGKPVLISIPDLSQPSLYHTPRNKPNSGQIPQSRPSIGVVSPPLEPQIAVKSTKRACIVGVALDCYYKQISQMPSWSKLDLCRFAADWAGQDCPCSSEFDNPTDDLERNGFSDGIRVCEIEDVVEEMGNVEITENGDSSVESTPRGAQIPLPWELLQPVLRILGHCLLAPLNASEVKDGASMAVRSLYARATHELVPQAILATRSLIQLDKRTRDSAKSAAMADSASSANTPSKAKKPEILLASK